MAAPTLDNQANVAFTGAGPATINLATSQNNVVICVLSYTERGTNPSGQITSITGGGLTFVSRNVASSLTNGILELWWANAPTTLGSTAFTVNYSATTDAGVILSFGVAGCATPSSPWDANVSLPATQASATTFTPGTTISTTSPNDFLLYFVGANANFAASIVEPTGFTNINRVAGGNFDFCDLVACYQGVSSKQSSQAFTWGSAISGQDTAYGIFDALVGPGAAPTAVPFFRGGFSSLPSPALAAAMIGADAIIKNKIVTRRGMLGIG